MQPKTTPLPVKWYLASFVGALALALILMGLFVVLTANEPLRGSNVKGDEVSQDHVASVSAPDVTQPPAPKPIPPPTRVAPPDTPAPVEVRPNAPSLWSLLVPNEVIAGALAIVGAAILVLIRKTVAMRKGRLT